MFPIEIGYDTEPLMKGVQASTRMAGGGGVDPAGEDIQASAKAQNVVGRLLQLLASWLGSTDASHSGA